MNFKDMILFILNFVTKSLQIELDDFFKKIHNNETTVTKQAFSQACRKVSPKAFICLLDKVNEWFYNNTPFEKYRGYRLLAIDGTILELHNSETLREVFRYIENQNATELAAVASFKDVSPAGVAVVVQLTEVLKKAYLHNLENK